MRALGDDNHARTLLILLRQRSDLHRNLLDIDRAKVVCLGEGLGFGLVAEDVVPVRRGGHQRFGEELADEGRGKVHGEDLARKRGRERERKKGGNE